MKALEFLDKAKRRITGARLIEKFRLLPMGYDSD